VSPVASVPEVVDDPHFAARATFATAHESEHGDFRQLGRTLAGMRRDTTTIEVRPGTVTDTGELLRAAGFDDDEIAALVAEGAVA
jgi:crotonobetainyl-CoA:carnitine CoA-transferase CaiB-like acyl-CoA transferase